MVNALFVTKRFGTYADICMMLGLARIARDALRSTKQPTAMQLLDRGTCYRIEFKKPVNLEAISKITYTNPFMPVCGKKTDRSKIPTDDIFDAVSQAEARKRYRDYLFQNRGKADLGENAPPDPPDPKTQNGVILTSMRHDKNHNDLWQAGYSVRDKYGVLVASLFEGFSRQVNSSINEDVETAAKLFKKYTSSKLPPPMSAVKIYLPTAIQGVNRVKADGNKADAQKADWLILWLIANGLFHFGVSERVKVAENAYDWRVVVLQPRDISLEKYRGVLDDLRKSNPPGGGHGIARFDAELVLGFCQKLLESHESKAIEQLEYDLYDLDIFKPANEFVSGFIGTHFGKKGQVYGVKEVFNLGLPGWIRPCNSSELQEYQNILKEHLSIIRQLTAEEGHSEMLAAYREFLTGNNWQSFFRFQVSYAEYLIRSLADPKARPPYKFSREGLDIMVKNQEPELTKITQDPGFLRIARAINSATVYAGKIKTKDRGEITLDWERTYGLAQRLSSQSGSKKDFVSEIAAFLASYENENLRLQAAGKELKRIWPTKDDLDRLIKLIDEFGSSLVANLLIAYGYAKWFKGDAEQQEDIPTSGIDDETEISDEGDLENE